MAQINTSDLEFILPQLEELIKQARDVTASTSPEEREREMQDVITAAVGVGLAVMAMLTRKTSTPFDDWAFAVIQSLVQKVLVDMLNNKE